MIVCEVMGRHAGWIALHSGMAGGADFILVPERPVDVEAVCAAVQRRQAAGLDFSIIVAAEGAVLPEGRGQDVGGDRRVRPRQARRDRRAPGPRDRGAHGLRDALGAARPRPARRHADGVRPLARVPLRPAGGRHGARRQFGMMAAYRGGAFDAGASRVGGREVEDGPRGVDRPRVRTLRLTREAASRPRKGARCPSFATIRSRSAG